MRRYFGRIGDISSAAKSREVTVEQEGSTLKITLDGEVHELDAVRLEGGALSLIVDGRSFSAEIEEAGDVSSVLLGGSVFPVEMLDERRLRLRAASGQLGQQGPQILAAPMPGKVVRVLVKAGDLVKEGQGLVVVEAMKMENELRAVRAGTVRELLVAEGVTVEGGAKLCVVD
ncbi:MAG: biotin/lipoyl-containing protein [Deltaproteobacteria bacterium]